LNSLGVTVPISASSVKIKPPVEQGVTKKPRKKEKKGPAKGAQGREKEAIDKRASHKEKKDCQSKGIALFDCPSWEDPFSAMNAGKFDLF